jgi:hypothetical protein
MSKRLIAKPAKEPVKRMPTEGAIPVGTLVRYTGDNDLLASRGIVKGTYGVTVGNKLPKRYYAAAIFDPACSVLMPIPFGTTDYVNEDEIEVVTTTRAQALKKNGKKRS